jgi:hypothetical protein
VNYENISQAKMGVKHSKHSVDISSTPIKAGVPVEEVNGKTAEDKTEKVETITKLNGEVEKANGVNGDAPATNGDIKAEDKETAAGDAPTEEKEGEVSKENEGNDDTAETKEECKKESVKDKIKKKLSMRSVNFLRRKAKPKDDGETSKNEEETDKTTEEDKAEEKKI